MLAAIVESGILRTDKQPDIKVVADICEKNGFHHEEGVDLEELFAYTVYDDWSFNFEEMSGEVGPNTKLL